MDLLELAKKTIRIEKQALLDLEQSLDQRFEASIERIYSCKGRVVITGIGKSAIVAQKFVATLNSTGTRAMFMHAADAVHGDLGMIDDQDLVICISKSGETPELKVLIPILKSYKTEIIAMTANENSFLAKQSHSLLFTPVSEEADPNKLAPTTSTTVQSSMGDAVATVLLTKRGFTPAHFAKFHPGGSLGKQMYLQVVDLYPLNKKPVVNSGAGIKEVLLSMSASRLGATMVVDEKEAILGIITDGDIRRWYQNEGNDPIAMNIMTKNPKTIQHDASALDAFQILRDNSISQLPVEKNGICEGMIHINDLLKEGFV